MTAEYSPLNHANGNIIVNGYAIDPRVGQLVTALVMRGSEYALPHEQRNIAQLPRWEDIGPDYQDLVQSTLEGSPMRELAEDSGVSYSRIYEERERLKAVYRGVNFSMVVRNFLDTGQVSVRVRPDPRLAQRLRLDPYGLAAYDLMSRGVRQKQSVDIFPVPNALYNGTVRIGRVFDNPRSAGAKHPFHQILGRLYALGVLTPMAQERPLESLSEFGPDIEAMLRA